MVRIRTVEEKIADKYPEGEMRCPVHLSIGQEAVAVGVCTALKVSDCVLGNHRSHAHYLAKGGDLYKMLAEIYGRADGCSRGRGGSMYLVDLQVNFLGSVPIVASSIPVATGVAWAEKLKHTGLTTAVFFGEAALEEGVTHEALNFAALNKLPIIYVCENNLYSVYTHLKFRQPPRSISNLVKGYGVTVFTGDGNDVINVYETAKQAVEKIEKGEGPVFIELATYRWREHCGPNFDNNIGYRTEAEFQKWKKTDPIKKLRKYLLRQKLMSEPELILMVKNLNQDLESLFQKAKSSPKTGELLTESNVYAKT